MALVAVLLLLALQAGCADDVPDPGSGPSPTVSVTRARVLEQQLLDRRARAIRTRNLPLFLRGIDRSDASFVAQQRRYFRNLAQLPLQRFAYRVLPVQWDRDLQPIKDTARSRVPEVELTFQLRGYDVRPVRRTVGFVFSYRQDRPVLVADRDATGEPMIRGGAAPWDLTAITVRKGDGVLAIFDRRTRASAPRVTAVVQRGIAQLQAALPFEWDAHVVVYHVEDQRVLSSFTDVPGGAIDHLGAMAFPEYANPARNRVASTRMLLMSSSVAAGEPFLGRIVRHELSHVALGTRDDGVPTWLSEGMAEYLGAREIPPRKRIIATAALTRASTAPAVLPASAQFNGDDQEWHYALSWMACDYIAATRGESRLWDLVEAMRAGSAGTRDADQDAVLLRVLGLDGHDLAKRAQERIRSIYG